MEKILSIVKKVSTYGAYVVAIIETIDVLHQKFIAIGAKDESKPIDLTQTSQNDGTSN